MLRFILTGFFLIVCKLACLSQTPLEQKFLQLNEAIENADVYDAKVIKNIDQLRDRINLILHSDLTARYELSNQLYNSYKLFRYDSAYRYASMCQTIAYQMGDRQKIAYSSIILNFTLLSSGLFKETADSLKSVDVSNVNDSIKAKYYALQARYYYDLADYTKDDFYTPKYNGIAGKYFDSALVLFPENSFSSLFYRALKEIRLGNRGQAKSIFLDLISKKDISYHEFALASSTLSDVYRQDGSEDSAISVLIDAAIADIKSSTKETSAMYYLAQLLYKNGEIKSASKYIDCAIHDATFYRARQRKVQLISVLPLIEAEKISQMEEERKNLIIYSSIITFLLALVFILTYLVFRKINKLNKAQKIITAAHQKEHEINKQLEETISMLSQMHIKEREINRALAESNNKLAEANKIKAEYIFFFFFSNYDFFNRIDRFKHSAEQKLADRKFEEIKFLINNINIRNEKEELLKNFDKAFVNIFPHFVESFNQLFHPDDRIKLKKGEILNTDLRIFALIRMGIHEIEKISQILEYSVNTINTYKTRIKNKSIVQNEEFEFRIMKIEST